MPTRNPNSNVAGASHGNVCTENLTIRQSQVVKDTEQLHTELHYGAFDAAFHAHDLAFGSDDFLRGSDEAPP